jgi:hypothetical protein
MRVREYLRGNGICLAVFAAVCVALILGPTAAAQEKPGAGASSLDAPVMGKGEVTAFSLPDRMIEIDHVPYILANDVVFKGKNDTVIEGFKAEYLAVAYRVEFVRIKHRIIEITILEYTS